MDYNAFVRMELHAPFVAPTLQAIESGLEMNIIIRTDESSAQLRVVGELGHENVLVMSSDS